MKRKESISIFWESDGKTMQLINVSIRHLRSLAKTNALGLCKLGDYKTEQGTLKVVFFGKDGA